MQLLFLAAILLLNLNTLAQKDSVKKSFAQIFESPEKVNVFHLSCIHELAKDPDCSYLPDDIDILINLQEIYMHEASFQNLPLTINKLKHLKRIELINCFFNYESQICKLAGLDSLEYLGLSSGNIRSLPECISTLSSLNSIDFRFNQNFDVITAISILKNLPRLESIDLSGIKTMKSLPVEIKDLASLKTIFLEYCSADFDYDKSFDILSRTGVSNLSLASSRISKELKRLGELTGLVSLDLSNLSLDSIPPSLSTDIFKGIKSFKQYSLFKKDR